MADFTVIPRPEKRVYYVSGKITDTTTERVKANLAFFFVKAEELRALGHEVFNPADHEKEEEHSYLGANDGVWERYMAIDIVFIVMHRPVMYMLIAWQSSRGARLEHALAQRLGLEIEYEGV